ncbi:MAG: hypothetical protein NUV55_03265 [Sulfuricaulis sp.]|uniref:hypothetical protein n=1 Tax=Sulfuricaulis sp. TaxID=2003553 RepID=UPI0025CEE4AD|nr:hypothetical protein [Sulfuricaulis sp.]MCR4346216.1 hypothetical protein [Sulfuricaulis sp.]
MSHVKGFSRVISMLLAIALVWAPALPSFAMMIKAGDAHAVHATHDGNHGNVSDTATAKQTPCTQHDSCDGQCCAFCAQCFGAVSMILPDEAQPHPVQSSILSELHPRLLVTSPDRPPRILSL